MNSENISLFDRISAASGRAATVCSCEQCRRKCRVPCLGTPDDIIRLLEAGYESRLCAYVWAAGMLTGVIERPIRMIQPRLEDNGWCTFYRDGLCELHDRWLKPTEGRLAHHTVGPDNLDPRKSVAWLVAREWLPLQPYIEALTKGSAPGNVKVV